MIDLNAVYQVKDNYRERVPGLRMKNRDWSVLFSIDGERSVADLSEYHKLPTEVVAASIQRLEESKLIAEVEISFDVYLKNKSRGRDAEEESSFDEFMAKADSTEANDEGFDAAPQASSNEELSEQTKKKVLQLRSLIDHIVAQAPSVTEGQLAVYRTFLRVSPDLMRQEGIQSLALVSDEVKVQDPKLQDEIASAVKTTLGYEVPGDVFEMIAA